MHQIRFENGIIYDHHRNNFQDLELVHSLYGIDHNEVARNESDKWLKDNKWKFWRKTLRLFEVKGNTGKLVKTYTY